MRGTSKSQWLVEDFTTYNRGKDRALILGELVELVNEIIETEEIPSLIIIPMYLNNLSMSVVSYDEESFHCRAVRGKFTEDQLFSEYEEVREQTFDNFSEEEQELNRQTIHLINEDDVATFQQVLIEYVNFIVNRAPIYYQSGLEQEEDQGEGIIYGYLLFQVILVE